MDKVYEMKQVFKVIDELEDRRIMPYISRDSIEFISMICRIARPENVLEIGTMHGYSSLWLSLYAKEVTALEINAESAAIARENFKKADCNNVNIILGDAIEILKKLDNKFDIILIDAMKSQYKQYLELSLKLLNKNGLIFADTTISHKEDLKELFDFLERSSLYYKELNLGRGLMVISNLH